ncbi:hypothetical protein AGMMS49545_09900 [Betaproteobacteria bacterium]|nr:hypothetical protein AGMMS49545_09900 [Betaproteobacteria bacterium]GHU42568.1 hypothetical protein AGMMS50289_07490 [Betaproteobacteria bacterium]
MNNKHRKTLADIFRNPLNGALEWARIENLLSNIGCDVIEGAGSQVSFCKAGQVLNVHRPHPQKEALRYRVKSVRDFLVLIGEAP